MVSRAMPASQLRLGKSSAFLIFPQISINFSQFPSNFFSFLPHVCPFAIWEGAVYFTGGFFLFFFFLLFYSFFIFISSLFYYYFYRVLLFLDYTTVHLVDGPPHRPNVGRVQVQYDDTLTDVCFEGNRESDRSWNAENLKVLCKQLGYPGYLINSSIDGKNSESVTILFTDDYKCAAGKSLKTASSVRI